MFLKKISVNNYKSIQHADVSFEDGLNIIIGKNGAGKSNLLNFINENVDAHSIYNNGKEIAKKNISFNFLLGEIVESSISTILFDVELEKKTNNRAVFVETKIKIRNEANSESETYTLNNQGDSQSFFKLVFEDSNFRKLQAFNKLYLSFSLPNNIIFLDDKKYFDFDGKNNSLIGFSSSVNNLRLFNLLSENIFLFTEDKFSSSDLKTIYSTEEYRSIFEGIISDSLNSLTEKYSLVSILASHTPIEDLRINPNINVYNTDSNSILIENLSIDFKVNGSWVPWSYLSDGTKRLFYIITECLSLESGMLLIEEPELGIHPHQLFSLMSFLKEQSRYKQIIISTHSPMVLDVLEPDELNRINIARITENGTQFSKLSEAKIAKAKTYITETGNLSYYWINSDLEDE